MSILGAILAGGAARRFGGGKHAALIDGRAMIDHVAAGLAPQCDALVVVGTDWPRLLHVEDAPAPGLGPLGGLAGALLHAGARGYDRVLTCGCDMPDVPADLAARLIPGPAAVAGQPLLGLWPADLGPALVRWLENGEDRAMRAWIDHAGARQVRLDAEPANINTQADLARYIAAVTPRVGPRSSR